MVAVNSSHEYVIKLKHNQTPSELRFGRILKQCIEDELPRYVGCIGKQIPFSHEYGFYIVDFYIGALKLGFEIDGGYHWGDKQINKDLKRDEFFLRNKNILLVHIPNSRLDSNRKRKSFKKELIEILKKRAKYCLNLKYKKLINKRCETGKAIRPEVSKIPPYKIKKMAECDHNKK